MTGRATQRRADFLTKFGSELRVAWFVTNASLTLDALVDDAEVDLPDVLFRRCVQVSGAYCWHTVTGPEGSHWLFVDVPVNAWSDPRRDVDRRATTPPDPR